MKQIAVVTSIFGDYDIPLEPVKQSSCHVDYYCFTDNKRFRSKKWNILNRKYHVDDKENDIEEYNSLSTISKKDSKLWNMMAAKYYKINHHRIPELKDYKATVWIDANFQIENNNFEHDLSRISSEDFAIFKHPARNTVKDEFIFSQKGEKYKSQRMKEQIERYRSEGFPDTIGLFACGFFLRSLKANVNQVMDLWWAECQRGSFQDQLSLPYAFWRKSINPTYIIKEDYFINKLVGRKVQHGQQAKLSTNIKQILRFFKKPFIC